MSREERVYNVGRKLKFTLTEDHLIEDGSRGVSHWRQAWPLQQLSPEVESQTGRPQGSVVTGMVFTMFSATVFSSDGLIVLLLNPRDAGRLICLPLLHPGEVIAVKSPATIA